MASLSEALAIALDHHNAGRWPEAAAVYTLILDAVPDHVGTLRLFGALCAQTGRAADALSLFTRALPHQADSPDLWFDLARAALLADRSPTGYAALQRVIALDPAHADGWRQLGTCLEIWGSPATALAALTRAHRLAATDPALDGLLADLIWRDQVTKRFHRAVTAIDERRPDAALADLRPVIVADPANAAVLVNLAVVHLTLRRRDDGLRWALRACAVQPDHPKALATLGDAYAAREQEVEAVVSYNAALALTPDDGDIRFNRACALLRLSHWSEGWADYEGRWQSHNLRRQYRDLPYPLWDGGSLAGRSILIHAEQGLGDTFQFCRYVYGVLALGPRQVIFEVQPQVFAVIRDSLYAPNLTLLPRGPAFPGVGDLPPVDCHIPLMSLPHRLDGRDLPIPLKGYLRASPGKAAAWDERLHELAPGARLRVGLVWQGNPDLQHDDIRSTTLAALAPLAKVPGVTLFSFQVGPAGDAAAQCGFPVHDLRPWLNDFQDTAAAFCRLDGVVSVCTGPAHLAGGLGCPTWLLLPKPGEWRWGRHPTHSRWYPTALLFRQQHSGDWSTPVAALADYLTEYSGTHNNSLPQTQTTPVF